MNMSSLLGIALLSACSSACVTNKPTVKDVVRIPQSLGLQGSDGYFRWEVHMAKDSQSPSGWRLPVTCKDAVIELRSLIPLELHPLMARAREETILEIGRNAKWSRSDFRAFHAHLAALIDEHFPGDGGYFWELKDWVLRAWLLDGDSQRASWRTVLCDPEGLAGMVDPSTRFDALALKAIGSSPSRMR